METQNAFSPLTESTERRADAANEITAAMLELIAAPSFTVKRIGPEAAEAFRALPEFRATGSRFVLFGDAQIRIETKLNGVAVLARIN